MWDIWALLVWICLKINDGTFPWTLPSKSSFLKEKDASASEIPETPLNKFPLKKIQAFFILNFWEDWETTSSSKDKLDNKFNFPLVSLRMTKPCKFDNTEEFAPRLFLCANERLKKLSATKSASISVAS